MSIYSFIKSFLYQKNEVDQAEIQPWFPAQEPANDFQVNAYERVNFATGKDR